jgi:hypothetical protein
VLGLIAPKVLAELTTPARHAAVPLAKRAGYVARSLRETNSRAASVLAMSAESTRPASFQNYRFQGFFRQPFANWLA